MPRHACRDLVISGAGKSAKFVFTAGDDLTGVKMGYVFTLERQQVRGGHLHAHLHLHHTCTYLHLLRLVKGEGQNETALVHMRASLIRICVHLSPCRAWQLK